VGVAECWLLSLILFNFLNKRRRLKISYRRSVTLFSVAKQGKTKAILNKGSLFLDVSVGNTLTRCQKVCPYSISNIPYTMTSYCTTHENWLTLMQCVWSDESKDEELC
jgi:hypothetical protein